MRLSNDQTPLDVLEALDTEPTPSEYDQELGRRIGLDAIRVSRGELSEAQFHEKYDAELRAEFGEEYSSAEACADE